MAIKEILQLGNPTLLEKSNPVNQFHTSLTQDLIKDLSDTLGNFRSQTGFGRAIAAPQIGILKQMIFVRMEEFCGPIINPKIIWSSPQEFELWDDCFSFPDLMVRVSRSVKIIVSYQDEKGLEKELVAENSFSELLQHEIDHLSGVLAVERAISKTSFSTRKEWLRQNT
ncbi:MAG: peptide deformylase [Acidobacteria bacterium]|nr:peptide deformylase [Acidobacteriota bacterium]